MRIYQVGWDVIVSVFARFRHVSQSTCSYLLTAYACSCSSESKNFFLHPWKMNGAVLWKLGVTRHPNRAPTIHYYIEVIRNEKPAKVIQLHPAHNTWVTSAGVLQLPNIWWSSFFSLHIYHSHSSSNFTLLMSRNLLSFNIISIRFLLSCGNKLSTDAFISWGLIFKLVHVSTIYFWIKRASCLDVVAATLHLCPVEG